MVQNKDTSTKSLFIALFIVGSFLLAIILIQTPQKSPELEQLDSVFAGAEDPIDTTAPPIGGSDEQVTNTPLATRTPSPIPIATITPTTTASATPIATFFLPTTTETPFVEQSPTPVPTFNLDLPGDTTPTETQPPVTQTENQGTNNMVPVIIAGVIGGLLLIAGIILFLLKKRNEDTGFTPPSGPTMPSAPPFQQPMNNTPTPGQSQNQDSGFSTPYDQYINNQPGPNNPNSPTNQ